MPRGGLRKPDADRDSRGARISAERKAEMHAAAAAKAQEEADNAYRAPRLVFETADGPAATDVLKPREVTTSLKLNNNSLVNLTGLHAVLERILWEPAALTSLDLSFNALALVPREVLELPNLSVLYLHGNNIDGLKTVDSLVQLPRLITLALHGNGVEGSPGYRHYVVSLLGGLRNLDFTSVTPKDRDNAVRWRRMHGPKKTRHLF